MFQDKAQTRGQRIDFRIPGLEEGTGITPGPTLGNKSAVVNIRHKCPKPRLVTCLKDLHHGDQIDRRVDGRKCRALPNTNRCLELGTLVPAPNVRGLPSNKVGPVKIDDFRGEPQPGDNGDQNIVVKRREELSKVEGQDRRLEPAHPPSFNEMCKIHTCVLSGVLHHSSELAGMEETEPATIKLEPIGKHLLKEFANRIEEGN